MSTRPTANKNLDGFRVSGSTLFSGQRQSVQDTHSIGQTNIKCQGMLDKAIILKSG